MRGGIAEGFPPLASGESGVAAFDRGAFLRVLPGVRCFISSAKSAGRKSPAGAARSRVEIVTVDVSGAGSA